MFGSEEGNKIDFGCFVKDVDSAFEVMVNTGWIGAESDTFTLKAVEMTLTKDFNAGFDYRFLIWLLCCTRKKQRQEKQEDVKFFHG